MFILGPGALQSAGRKVSLAFVLRFRKPQVGPEMLSGTQGLDSKTLEVYRVLLYCG